MDDAPNDATTPHAAVIPPPPGHQVEAAPLPYLPSARQIADGNADVCFAILEAVQETQAHVGGRSYLVVVNVLWNQDGTGLFNGRFRLWSHNRRSREMKDRVKAILDHYADHDEAYPSPIQSLAHRLQDEVDAFQLEADQRAATEASLTASLESANNHREGTMGALPRGFGTGVPTIQDAGRAFR